MMIEFTKMSTCSKMEQIKKDYALRWCAPKLRFKEFSGEWKIKKLGDISDVVIGSTRTKLYKCIKHESDCLNFFTFEDADIDLKYITSIKYKIKKTDLKNKAREVNIGDVILCISMNVGRPHIMKIKACLQDGWAAVTHTCDNISREYLYYMFLSPSSQKFFLNYSVGVFIKGINLEILKSLPVSFPEDKKEQEKIAKVLGSLDALIETRNKKVEALKKHKKGLTQRLFPTFGEREPKLRFQEFSGEWEEKELKDIAKIFGGKGITKADIKKNGRVKCILFGELSSQYDEIIAKIKSKTNLNKDDLVFAQKNDVLIPSSFYTCFYLNAFAHCILIDGVAIDGYINIVRSKEDGVFLAYYLSHGIKYRIIDLVHGIIVIHLYAFQIEKLKLQLPTQKEQEKIANTLSSLDALIEAQNKKVEALKKHKKGLLQQLFPEV